jgi:hypothetical protein
MFRIRTPCKVKHKTYIKIMFIRLKAISKSLIFSQKQLKETIYKNGQQDLY